MVLSRNPEFYDIFGLGVFVFILAIGIYELKTRKKLPMAATIALILIGISGLIVDGLMVYLNFIKKF